MASLIVSTFQNPRSIVDQGRMNGEKINERIIANPVTKAVKVKIPIGNFKKMNKRPLQVAESVKKLLIFCHRD
jgi:hypothetical protein